MRDAIFLDLFIQEIIIDAGHEQLSIPIQPWKEKR
jgi:hypothetical protein